MYTHRCFICSLLYGFRFGNERKGKSLKNMVSSMKNIEENIARKYITAEAVDVVRILNPSLFVFDDNAFATNIKKIPVRFASTSHKYCLAGEPKEKLLDASECAQLRTWWFTHQPSTKDAIERSALNATCTSYNRVFIDDLMFRTQICEAALTTMNCGIGCHWLNDDDEQQQAYGTLTDIIVHRAYSSSSSPVAVLMKVDWFDSPSTHSIGLQLVRKNKRSAWNHQYPLIDIKQIIARNFVFWPKNPNIAQENNKDFFVIYFK